MNAAATAAALDEPGRTLQLDDDHSLHLIDGGGEGRPVVLIHGAMVDHADWLGDPWDALNGLCRIISIDRPGHGLSRRLRTDASPEGQARWVRAGLRALGVSNPLLVGHSFGGMVALAYAAAYPQEVSGLVLAGPLAFPEFRPLEHLYLSPRAAPVSGPLIAQSAEFTTDPAFWLVTRRLMFAPQSPPERWRRTFDVRRVTRPEKLVSEGEDAATILPGAPTSIIEFDRITAPTVVLYGDRDIVADPRRHAERLPAAIPQAELRKLQGVGHMLHHAAPDELARAVGDVLGKRSR